MPRMPGNSRNDKALALLENGAKFTLCGRDYYKLDHNRYLDHNFNEFNTAQDMLAQSTVDKGGPRKCGSNSTRYLTSIISNRYNNVDELLRLVLNPASSA